MNPFFANSRVNLLVIFSSSCSLYSLGLSLRPAFPPPNGTSTQAHLKVISADKAFTSSRVTSSENRIPATFDIRLLLHCTECPTTMSMLQDLIHEAVPCQKSHINLCLILNGYTAMGI